MRIPRRLRVLLPVLAASAALAAAAPPAHAQDPVGGVRLAGPDAVSSAAAALPAVTAASYVVADLDTGEVLAAKDPHGRYAPASTLKALTAVTLIPRLDPATAVTPAAEDVNVDGSKVGLVRELSYSAKDLLTALMVVSGNDAAGALATAVGGQQAAADLMNDEARRLQARDTHAVNTSGLDADGQTSSAYDLALIARAGMAMPDFRAYVATRRALIPAPGGTTIEIGNHNRLLYRYDGALGVKNGYTTAARASFIGAASREGRTVVATLMRAEPNVWQEAAALLDWGFAATAAGVEPIGELVDPMGAPDATPAPEAPTPAEQAEAVPLAAAQDGSGALPLLATALLVLLAALVLLRRRAVVRARRRRRAAAARPPAPTARRRTAPSNVRTLPRR